MLRALQALPGVEVRLMPPRTPRVRGLLGRMKRRWGKTASITRADLDDSGLDIILGLVASDLIVRFGTSLHPPILHVTDATPSFLRAFYPYPLPRDAEAREARALSVADCAVYSSAYMAQRAQAEFDLAPERVHAIPFGVNLDHLPATLPQKPSLAPLNLLFIGMDWTRKGGEVALSALDALLAADIPARLTVIGCSPPAALAHPAVEVLGYLDKNRPEQATRLAAALTQAHLLVLPTRADCTPMVVAEANAHGCPVLITDVGGVSSLMAPGQNGRMLPQGADGAAYATAIRELTADPAAYTRLSAASFAHCHAHLTWNVWAQSMLEVMRGCIASRQGV